MSVTSTWVCVDVMPVDENDDTVTLVQNPTEYTVDTSRDTMQVQAGLLRFVCARSEGIRVGSTVTVTAG